MSFPVPPGTPGLASAVLWDHGIEWAVANFSGPSRSGENVIEIDLNKAEDEFLAGHEIDGRILFPATGYLVSEVFGIDSYNFYKKSFLIYDRD